MNILIVPEYSDRESLEAVVTFLKIIVNDDFQV